MINKTNIDIKGSVNGIVNFGDNTININESKKSSINELDSGNIKNVDIIKNTDKIESKKESFSNNIIKTIIEIIIGVTISVIAGYILYKLNLN